MSNSCIILEVSNGVARITLNRPEKRNALTREMLAELIARLHELSKQPEVRCLLLAARGPWFCPGMDLSQMQQAATQPDAAQVWQADTRMYRQAVQLLFERPIPTIALVQGGAFAGGLGLGLACDIMIATTDAVFALPEPKRGITAAIVTPFLVHRVGMGPAAYLLLSGESLSAQQAHQAGICQILAEPEQLEFRATQLVRTLLSGAPGALGVTKRQFRACSPADVVAQLDLAERLSADARSTAEAREGLAAFLEKRPPAWQPSLEDAPSSEKSAGDN
jgi:methylglutaconyl-CoA hydratase